MTTSANRRDRGFTFVELLVTAVVLGTAFIAASWSVSATARTKAVYASTNSPALFLAKELHELAEGLPRVPSGTTGATTGGAVVALDSLIGASFSPPIHSDGTLTSEYAEWSQHVSLAVYDMADLSTPTADAPEDGLPADAARLYRLEVLMRRNGQDIDTFHWWINP